MVGGLIYTYALIKALYDEGGDYVDSFWPFAVKAIPQKKSVTSTYIQKRLEKNFNLKVPLHVLEIILARAEGRNYIERERHEPTNTTKYRLTEVGLDYSTKLETDKEVDRRINALLESVRRFFEGKSISLSLDQIRESLIYFLHKNIDFLVECINPSVKVSELAPPKFKGYDRYLLEYIKSADHQEPDNYKILQDMVMGSVISVLLYVKEPEEIAALETKKFGHCQVFLDTNFVFSILGLHTEEFNEPAKELLALLKGNDFDLKVFGFTVNEISRVINLFHKESRYYPTTIRVDTLYSNLKRKGWRKTDAREFIINVEQTLQQQGITIEWTKDANLHNYTPNEGLVDAIKKYKPLQSVFHRNHDLASIEKIRELREKTIRRIEDSKALFLTSDARLNRFNFVEFGHKQNGTICETILDRLLANILWLKNPHTEPPLKSIIAAHSRGLFVDRRVWDRFYEVLQELKREGKISDEDISTLLWHSYVEDALRPIEETETSKITPQFVLEEIEKAEKLREEALEKRIEGIEKSKEEEMKMKLKKAKDEFLESLEQSTSEVEMRKEREWLDKIQAIKEGLRDHSRTTAANRSNLYTLAFALAYIAVVMVAYFVIPSDVLALILTVVGGGGIIGLWKFRSKMRSWLLERTYRQKLKETKLAETQ